MIVALPILVASWSGTGDGMAVLKDVRTVVADDTIRLELAFSGTRPRRERIGRGADPGRKEIWIEFEGARPDSALSRKWPRWLRDRSGEASGMLALRIDLAKETPWSASWSGDTLRVGILDRVGGHPLWKNPWVLGATGAALVGGGVVLWMGLGSESSPAPGAPSPTPDLIPPPDIAMPE